MGIPSERFTKVSRIGENFHVQWEHIGNLPTGQGMGIIRGSRRVKKEQIFAPFPLSFYRIVEDETGVYLEKLEQMP